MRNTGEQWQKRTSLALVQKIVGKAVHDSLEKTPKQLLPLRKNVNYLAEGEFW